jgi:hypothetical protein
MAGKTLYGRIAARLGVVAMAGFTTAAVCLVDAGVAHASSVGGSITRPEVIARAQYWLDRGDTWYSQQQSNAISDGAGALMWPSGGLWSGF